MTWSVNKKFGQAAGLCCVFNDLRPCPITWCKNHLLLSTEAVFVKQRAYIFPV